MKCRQCGSEIADNALVCYRCGTATSEPKFKAPPARRTGPPLGIVAVLVAILVVLCGLYLTQLNTNSSPVIRWAIVVVTALIVGIRLMRRRSRR